MSRPTDGETDAGNSDVALYYDPETEQWESIRLSAFALEEFGNVRVEQVMASSLIWVERETPPRGRRQDA